MCPNIETMLGQISRIRKSFYDIVDKQFVKLLINYVIVTFLILNIYIRVTSNNTWNKHQA